MGYSISGRVSAVAVGRDRGDVVGCVHLLSLAKGEGAEDSEGYDLSQSVVPVASDQDYRKDSVYARE